MSLAHNNLRMSKLRKWKTMKIFMRRNFIKTLLRMKIILDRSQTYFEILNHFSNFGGLQFAVLLGLNPFTSFWGICGALRDLVPFVQFKKREKHPWRSVNFTNGTKSCNASHFRQRLWSRYFSKHAIFHYLFLEYILLFRCVLLINQNQCYTSVSLTFPKKVFCKIYNCFVSLLGKYATSFI